MAVEANALCLRPFFSSPMTAMSRLRFVSLLVFAVLIARAVSGDAESTTDENILRAIERLGSSQQAVRQQAARELWEAGLAAEPALVRAAESKDAEVRYRAN